MLTDTTVPVGTKGGSITTDDPAVLEELQRQENAPPSGVLGGDTMAFPDSGPRASAPAPQAPVVPGAVPMSEIVANLWGPQGAQSRVMETAIAKERAMGPAIDTVTAAINGPRPERPVAPTLPAPPSRGLRAFLQPTEGQSPEASIQQLIGAIGLFAMGLGGGAGSAKASLAALTGAMAGWAEGDRVRADRAFEDWQAKTNTMLKQWEIQSTEYKQALEERGLDLAQKEAALRLTALKHDNALAVAQLEKGGLGEFLKWQTEQQKHADDVRLKEQEVGAAWLRAQLTGLKGDTVTIGDQQYRVTFDAAGREIGRSYIGAKAQGQGTESERAAAAENAYKKAQAAFDAAPTPENQAALDAAKEKNDVAIAAYNKALGLAGAKATAVLNAQRDLPMTPKETEGLINPNTLTGPPPGMSMNQAIAGGYVEVDEKDRAAIADLKSTQAIVGTMTAMTRKLITATTPGEAARQYAELTAGARTGSNPLARTYEQTVASFLGTVSRSLAGERGVLTNQDLDRIRASFPGFFDTRAVAEAKERMLDLLIDTSMRARVAKMTKQPFDETAFRSRIDAIITGLENAGGQAGGARVRVIGPRGADGKAPEGTVPEGTPLPPGWSIKK